MAKQMTYQVRFYVGNQYSKPVGTKYSLKDYRKAGKIVKRLKKSGVEAFAVKLKISQTTGDKK